MTHRFPIKEIARQAALGTATVDRVLNGRAHVSAQTRARVLAAIDELTAQEAQLAARGRRLFFDIIAEAPTRFSREVRTASEAVLPQIGSAVCRPRFLMQEIMEEGEVIDAIRRILKRGSHGVCLKARDTPKIREAVDRLWAAGIPVVTLVTDIAGTNRIAYAGLDNGGAGRTAAYLLAKSLGDGPGEVLATRSHEGFLGEKERETAFAEALARHCPKLDIVSVEGGSGVPFETSRVLADAVGKIKKLRAVYSMGGGNGTILEVLRHNGLQPEIYIAHDLDQENRKLLAEGHLDFVLHHDLQKDMRQAFNAFLVHHRLLADNPAIRPTDVQVVTPLNIPASG